ncbi:hypothetical protein ACN38_g1514 [Penicillium nordicum]|uniref:Uncharacterized protein n=1 Tax=Penicillium nordicum TaxID=229535 RepID=A0A0M9WJQ5_9EURO|nr:hypothetical protein ACN38_g1514 [Penicillium nordicum]
MPRKLQALQCGVEAYSIVGCHGLEKGVPPEVMVLFVIYLSLDNSTVPVYYCHSTPSRHVMALSNLGYILNCRYI